jgi:hypothetical protein
MSHFVERLSTKQGRESAIRLAGIANLVSSAYFGISTTLARFSSSDLNQSNQ